MTRNCKHARTPRRQKAKRRKAREAYLHFDPDAPTDASSESAMGAEAAAQRRRVGCFAGIIAGLDAPSVRVYQRALQGGQDSEAAHRSSGEQSPTYLPTSPA